MGARVKVRKSEEIVQQTNMPAGASGGQAKDMDNSLRI